MKKLKQDMALMLAIMILSALVYLVFIPAQIKLPPKADIAFTNRTFPQFTIAVIFIASALGFANAAIKYVKERKTAAVETGRADKAAILAELKPLIGAALILCYAFLFKTLSALVPGWGFVISTALFIPVFLAFMGCKKWQYYVYVYAFASIMFVVFKYVLHIMFR